MSEIQGQNQGATATLDKKPEAPAAPKRRLFTRNGKPAAKAPVVNRPATLADLANTVPFVPEPRGLDQETGALPQPVVESTSSEKPEAKKQIDITVAGLEGQNGQDLLRATAAMDAHEKMQHLASGGKQYEGKFQAIKGTVKEMALHPVKFAAKVWQMGMVDKAVRAEMERSGMQQMLTLGTDAPLPRELKSKIQEVAQKELAAKQGERGKLGKLTERGSKAMKIIKAERSAIVAAEQQVSEKMRRVVEMPADVLNKSENAELKLFDEQNKDLITGYRDVLSGQAAARDAMLEQLAISKELDDATDAGKQLTGQDKEKFVRGVLMPTVSDALVKRGKLEGVDAELAIQHRLMDFGENLSHATDLLQKANEIAEAILKTEDHVKGAAATKAVEDFFADQDVNINLATVKVEDVAEMKAQRSRVTEKAIKRLKESGGAAEVFTDNETAAMARWEALNASKTETWSAVGGALVGYAAVRGASAAGRVVGAWVGGTAVMATRVAHRVGQSHERSVAMARTAAARGEQVGKNMKDIVVAPMRNMEGTTKQLKDSLKQVQSGSLSGKQTETVLAQIAAVDARNKAGDAAGFTLWSSEQGANYAVAKRDMEKTRLELVNGLRDKSSLPELKAIATRLGVDVADSGSKNAHIDAIRGKLGSALQDNISTGKALGEDVASVVRGVDDDTISVKESKNKALKAKVKAQAKAAAMTAAVGATFAEAAVGVHMLADVAVAGGNAPQMETVASTTALEPSAPTPSASASAPDVSATPGLGDIISGIASKADAASGGGSPVDATSGGGSHVDTSSGGSSPADVVAPSGGKVDVLNVKDVWTKNALPIDERTWHNNTGQGFHTLKGDKGELILQHKGLKGKKNLSFTFDLPKGDKVEPLTIKANDLDHGALKLDPNSDKPVTLVTEHGDVQMSQKEAFAMLVDKKEFGKIKDGTDFASEVHTKNRDVFRIGGEDGKKGTIEVTVLKTTKNAKGETTTHADVYSTIRGTGKTPEQVDVSSVGSEKVEVPSINTPVEPWTINADSTGVLPDVEIKYPGKLILDKDNNVIVEGKPNEAVFTKDQMLALQTMKGKISDLDYGLSYDRATNHFDLVDQSTHITVADNITFGKDTNGTPKLNFRSSYIKADASEPTGIKYTPPDSTENPITLLDEHDVSPQALVDNHASGFKDVDWIRKNDQKFHTIMRDDGNTLRLQQNSKADYIAFRVGDKMMLAEAKHGTHDGKTFSYVDLNLKSKDKNDTVSFYSTDGTSTKMQRGEFAHLVVNENALDSYLKDMKQRGILDKEGNGNIETQVNGGAKIFGLENPKDGKGSYVSAATVVKDKDGKSHVELFSTIDANGKMPDTITTTEAIVPEFKKTADGFVLGQQNFEYTGDVSKLHIDAKTGDLVDKDHPLPPILSKAEMVVMGRISANDNFVMRYDGTQWDLVGKNGVTYVENIKIGTDGKSLTYVSTGLAKVKVEMGQLVIDTSKTEPKRVTITLPTPTGGTTTGSSNTGGTGTTGTGSTPGGTSPGALPANPIPTTPGSPLPSNPTQPTATSPAEVTPSGATTQATPDETETTGGVTTQATPDETKPSTRTSSEAALPSKGEDEGVNLGRVGLLLGGAALTTALVGGGLVVRRNRARMRQSKEAYGATQMTTENFFSGGHASNLPDRRLTQLKNQTTAVSGSKRATSFGEALGMLSQMGAWHDSKGFGFVAYPAVDSSLKNFVTLQMTASIKSADTANGGTPLPRVSSADRQRLENIIVEYAIDRHHYNPNIDAHPLALSDQRVLSQLIDTATLLPAYFNLNAESAPTTATPTPGTPPSPLRPPTPSRGGSASTTGASASPAVNPVSPAAGGGYNDTGFDNLSSAAPSGGEALAYDAASTVVPESRRQRIVRGVSSILPDRFRSTSGAEETPSARPATGDEDGDDLLDDVEPPPWAARPANAGDTPSSETVVNPATVTPPTGGGSDHFGFDDDEPAEPSPVTPPSGEETPRTGDASRVASTAAPSTEAVAELQQEIASTVAGERNPMTRALKYEPVVASHVGVNNVGDLGVLVPQLLVDIALDTPDGVQPQAVADVAAALKAAHQDDNITDKENVIAYHGGMYTIAGIDRQGDSMTVSLSPIGGGTKLTPDLQSFLGGLRQDEARRSGVDPDAVVEPYRRYEYDSTRPVRNEDQPTAETPRYSEGSPTPPADKTPSAVQDDVVREDDTPTQSMPAAAPVPAPDVVPLGDRPTKEIPVVRDGEPGDASASTARGTLYGNRSSTAAPGQGVPQYTFDEDVAEGTPPPTSGEAESTEAATGDEDVDFSPERPIGGQSSQSGGSEFDGEL